MPEWLLKIWYVCPFIAIDRQQTENATGPFWRCVAHDL